MYLFVYKTTHTNGKYYIGRHQTENLDDGYMGSGNWVKSIKDKTSLKREILVEATDFNELCELEEHYINLHWKDPLCMNFIKGSNGWVPEDSLKIQQNRIKDGTHHFLKREDGSSIGQKNSKKRVEEGTHHLLKRSDGTSLTQDRIRKGTHHFLKEKDGDSIGRRNNEKRVKEGTHNLLKRQDGSSVATDLIKAGKHNFFKADGTSLNQDRINAGTHNLVGNVSCRNKENIVQLIPKEQYHSQNGEKESWEWVYINSKEGKRRKS